MAETAWLSAEKRVCRQLGRLVGVFERGLIRLRQVELAPLAQTTRPTVSSVLGDLARERQVIVLTCHAARHRLLADARPDLFRRVTMTDLSSLGASGDSTAAEAG